ncbi:integrase core domain-containing protein [Actinomyces qiguomingii]|uniref:integrase core domain-containing protein n=1 Tax=Actinomyces qiguomingii TaxID=2057800 RepID=UPI000CA0646F
MCWDNAWAESFNATLKNERVHRMAYSTRNKAIQDVAAWIELTYNQSVCTRGSATAHPTSSNANYCRPPPRTRPDKHTTSKSPKTPSTPGGLFMGCI